MLLPLLLNNMMSGSPTLVEVPDVVGASQAAGTATLEGDAFVVAVATAYSSVVPVGYIISQSPAAGSEQPEGSTVTITVSLGDAPSTSGNYKDGTLFDAAGRMATVWLGTNPLPGGSKMIQGLAHDAAGRRYLASGSVAKHIGGLAVRRDGVQVAATSGQAGAVSGLPVNAEGAIVVSTNNPSRAVEGFGIDAGGKMSVTDAS